jgi:hypothetical protein
VIQRHYEVVVLGRGIGALTAAALLARRDFTVLLAGHGAPAPTYRVGDRILCRRVSTFLAGTSPTWKRVLGELAHTQTWRRRATPIEPLLQAIVPGRRFEIPTNARDFTREIDREFPELHRVIEDLYGRLADDNGAVDEAFSDDLVWPPGTFWERRATGKRAQALPYAHSEPDADLLSGFPRGHLVRQLVRGSVMFGTHLSTLPPPLAVARLHGAWTRGLLRLPDGEQELESMLIERIEAHGGRCALDSKATSLALRRGSIVGVHLDGEPDPIGCDYVITDDDGEALAALAAGQGIHKNALREWPRITSTVGRFVTSIVVRREGLPEPLGPEVLLFAKENPWAGRRAPVVHLQRCDQPDGTAVLAAEILLPDHGALPLREARAFVLRSVLAELPFLERHLLLVDSPHDGLPLWSFEPSRRELDRRSLGLAAQEPMVRQLEVDPPGFLRVAGEPLRGPIERTLLVGRSVLPGLGQEGELLAAWSAALLVTKGDRQKALMRRDTWTKMELG